jgi:hypothetical protein
LGTQILLIGLKYVPTVFAKTNATGIPTIEMNRPAIWKIVAIARSKPRGSKEF